RSWKSPQNSSAPPPAASSGPPLSLSLQAAAPSASASTGRARVERAPEAPPRAKPPWRPARTRPHETSAGAPSSTLPTAGAGPHRRAPRTGRSAVDAADLDEVGGHDLARDGPRVELLGRDVLERVLGRALAHTGEHRVERRPLLGDLRGRRDGRHPGGVGGVARLQLLVLRRLGVQGLHLGAELLAPLAGELAVDAQRVAELVAPAGGRLVLPRRLVVGALVRRLLLGGLLGRLPVAGRPAVVAARGGDPDEQGDEQQQEMTADHGAPPQRWAQTTALLGGRTWCTLA